MMKLAGAVLGCIIFVILTACADKVSSGEREALDATVILYNREKQTACAAFAFEKEGQLYRFLTVAHCIVGKEGEVLDHDVEIGIQGRFREARFPARLVVFDDTLVTNKGLKISDGFAVFEAELPPGRAVKILPFSGEPAPVVKTLRLVSYFGLPDSPVIRGRVFKLSDFDCLASLGETEYCGQMLFLAIRVEPGCSGAAVFDEKGVRGIAVHRLNIKVNRGDGVRTKRIFAGAIPSQTFLLFWGAYKNKLVAP